MVLLFIFVCFKATRLVREKLGILAAILFVFGLFSFMSRPKRPNERENDKHKWSWEQKKMEDRLSYHYQKPERVILYKNLLFSINLKVIYYTNDNTKEVVPLKAYSYATGIFGGYKWEPVSISINRSENGKDFQYNVSGTIESSLLGTTIHYNYKEYSGILKPE